MPLTPPPAASSAASLDRSQDQKNLALAQHAEAIVVPTSRIKSSSPREHVSSSCQHRRAAHPATRRLFASARRNVSSLTSNAHGEEAKAWCASRRCCIQHPGLATYIGMTFSPRRAFPVHQSGVRLFHLVHYAATSKRIRGLKLTSACPLVDKMYKKNHQVCMFCSILRKTDYRYI